MSYTEIKPSDEENKFIHNTPALDKFIKIISDEVIMDFTEDKKLRAYLEALEEIRSFMQLVRR